MLYPAGYFARQIRVRPEVKLPHGWQSACALSRGTSSDLFNEVPLDVLIASPLFAGKHFKSFPLDDEVSLNVFADKQATNSVRPAWNTIAPAKLAGWRDTPQSGIRRSAGETPWPMNTPIHGTVKSGAASIRGRRVSTDRSRTVLCGSMKD